MKKILFIGLLAITAGLATSCGGGGGQPLTKSAAGTVLFTANAALLKLPKGNTAPSLAVPGLSTSADRLGATNTNCETISPSPIVDADGDGIAAQKTYTFDCANETSSGSTVTQKGSMTVKDRDESVSGMNGGMRVDYNITQFRSKSTNGSITDQSFVGHWDYQNSAGSIISTSLFEGRYFSFSPTFDFETDYKQKYQWDYKLTPDNSNDTFNTGSVEFVGSFTFEGKFVSEDSSGTHKQFDGVWVMKYYSKNLRFDKACSKWYKSGSIFWDDGNGSKFEFRYDCDTAKLYIDGVESDVFKP